VGSIRKFRESSELLSLRKVIARALLLLLCVCVGVGVEGSFLSLTTDYSVFFFVISRGFKKFKVPSFV